MRMSWLLFALSLMASPLRAQSDGPFPHSKHARLFPLCSSCHVGIAIGDQFRSFPSQSLCASCHDGTIKPRVQWTPPPRRVNSFLVFTHQQHAATAKVTACESCHAPGGTTAWMNVARAAPAQCISCHTHGTGTHFGDTSPCATCHRTLATAAGLTDAQVAALPKPPSHARVDFASLHGSVARAAPATCATCHARESCQRCHVDGTRQPLIRALAPDARIARLMVGRPAVYPTPADHRVAQFAVLHGAAAHATPLRCATCHARASCETCHTGTGARDVLRGLPNAREATAPGVQLRHAPLVGVPDLSLVTSVALHTLPPCEPGRSDCCHPERSEGSACSPTLPPLQIRHDTTLRVVRVHAVGFAKAHGAQAASGSAQCASCHAQRFCIDCHAGERVTRRYHVANFVSIHAPQAYRRETDCASCHSIEAFCRDCHRQTGLAATSNTRSTVFHNAQPLWLLQHGKAARQDLQSCTTCHQQTYCMQCHSDLGSRLSPHGPGFDAARMSARNPRQCLYCHFKNPLAR